MGSHGDGLGASALAFDGTACRVLAFAVLALLASACSKDGGGTLQYTIEQASDCEQLLDYPYARNLFCPATFSAVQSVLSTIAASLGERDPIDGYFYYYQTVADPEDPPDDQSQTTAACLLSEAPWGSAEVVGAGTPLCDLVAYVTSTGPLPGGAEPASNDNPVPDGLRAFPDYFTRLFPPNTETLLADFQSGGAFDPIVRNLGADTYEGFVSSYPAYAADALYDPADWRSDPQYYGISGGGGGGWGGEVCLALPGGDMRTLLSFGGGGGGGMTSTRTAGVATTSVGGGGGGGMQLANGYSFDGVSYDGLGLGAGTSNDEAVVQYSYNDYADSGRSTESVNNYNPAVISDYQDQMSNLVGQLQAGLAAGGTVVVRGGGGMGAGTEYLKEDGEEWTPHALSTQAGFSFRYEFGAPAPADSQTDDDSSEEAAYAQLGDFYEQANAEALSECGDDYSDYSCICPKQQAIVMCLMAEALGDATEVPSWLSQQHCPNDDTNVSNQLDGGLTNYQQLLLDSIPSTAAMGARRRVLRRYFNHVNR
ncbi:MAG: hypothetical protein AAGF92_14415 [Myxococcota bacterium]